MNIEIEREKLERMLMLLAVATFHTPALQAERTELVEAGLKALAAPVQEPVAWLDPADGAIIKAHVFKDVSPPKGWRPIGFIDAPPAAQRQWVVLTDEEIDQGLCRTPYAMKTAEAWREGVRWAYHQLKEKNTP